MGKGFHKKKTKHDKTSMRGGGYVSAYLLLYNQLEDFFVGIIVLMFFWVNYFKRYYEKSFDRKIRMIFKKSERKDQVKKGLRLTKG